ncbi:MAG TPA: hybrid sensor histidine kinase/response regulator [Anaeromyxobacter sp.]
MTGRDPGERVVICAPLAQDGPLTARVLRKAGFDCVLAVDVEAACSMVQEGAAAVLIAHEALAPAPARRLADLLARQDPWSDLPVIVFARTPGRTWASAETYASLGNVTLLDRPVQVATLVTAVRAALRARRRQYAARDVLQELAASVQSRDRFLAMLGHELRNPLGAVSMASDLLGQPGADPTRPRAIIARQTKKLARLVDDLLEVSRVASGKIVLKRVCTDLRGIVERSLESVEPLVERGGVSIHLALPREQVLVDGDPVRLDQIVGNLVSNAAKYTPRGGTIDVELESQRPLALLRVRDTGIGIAPEMLERIFEPFTQADSSVGRSEGGLGLGLSLVRGLVALHGGRVEAHSEGQGRGSEFVVELPLSETSRLADDAAARLAPRAPRCRVLVVEDSEDIRCAMLMMLEQLGHLPGGAGDGPSGVRLAFETRPHVAFVDIGLPGFDGYEVARRIREALGREVRLVAVTGYGQAEDRERTRLAGFDVHLVKPVDAEAIRRVMDGVQVCEDEPELAAAQPSAS